MVKKISYGGYGNLIFDDDATPEQIQEYVDNNYKMIENRFNVPPPKLGGIPFLPDSVERGFRRAQQAFNVGTLELGFEDPESAAYDIRQYEQRIKEIPLDKDDDITLQQISKAETTGEALAALAKNPSVILPIIGESIGTYLPTVAVAGGVALATRGSAIPLLSRIVGGLATGSGSAATEYGTSFIEAVSETGVDINDGIALATAFNDPKVLAEARNNAKKRAIPIGAFDALAFGTAGLLTKAIKDAGRVGLGARVAGATGETVQAGSLGALGEATAQIMTDGFVSRPGEVLLEGIAEGPIGIVEAGLAARPDKNYEVSEYKKETDDGASLRTPRITQIKKLPAPKINEKEKQTEFNINIGEIQGKIYNTISEVSKTQTKDGIGGSKIRPKDVRESKLSKVEQQFLKDNPNVEAQIYQELEKNNVIKKEGEDFILFSPYDMDTIQRTEKAKKKVRKKKVEPIKISKPMFPANFQKKAPTIEEIDKTLKQPIDKAFFNNENSTSPLEGIEQTEIEIFLENRKTESVVTKEVYNLKNNKVVGKIQQIRASGTKPIKYGAIALNKPSGAKIFNSEKEAETYLTNELQNEKQEITDNEEINETPSVAIDPDPTSTIDTNKKAINFNVFKDFIAQSYQENKKTNNIGLTRNEKPINRSEEQIQQIDQRLNNESTPEAQESDEINEAGNDEKQYTYTDKQIKDDRNFFKKAGDFLTEKRLSIGRTMGMWFSDFRHGASKDKELAKVLNVVVKQSEFRGRIYEELMAIMKPWAELTDIQAERVAKVAIFARNEAKVNGAKSKLEATNNQITVTQDEIKFGTQLDTDGQKNIKFGVSHMFKPETITISGIEVDAYNALIEMANYERQLVIEQTIDQLKDYRIISPKIKEYLKNLNLSTNYSTNILDAQRLVKQLRELGDNVKNTDQAAFQTLKNSADRIDNISRQIGNVYFPMSRSGDKYVAVTKNVIKNNELKKEVVFWKAFDTNRGLNVSQMNKAKTFEKKLLDDFSPTDVVELPDGTVFKDKNGKPIKLYDHSGVKSNTYNSIAKRVGSDFVESLDAFLQLAPIGTDPFTDPNQNKEFIDGLKARAIAMKDSKGIPTFLRESRMIAGFDPADALDAIGKHINSFATWDSGFVFDRRRREAFDQAKADGTTYAAEYTEKLENYLDEDPLEFQSLRQVGFLYFLTDVSASAMNMFQGIPSMVYNGQYAGQLRAAKKQAAVTKKLFARGITPTLTTDNQFDLQKLSRVYGPSIPLFRDPNNLLSSVINPSRANEYLGKQTADFIKGQKIIGLPRGKAKLEKITRTLGALFTTTEVANRLASYISSYELTADRNTFRKAVNYSLQDEVFKVRLSDDLQLDPNTILQNIDDLTPQQNESVRDLIARNAVEETQFLYGKDTKPRINRGWGALAFQFSEYPTMMILLMKRLLRNRGREGKKAFGVYMLALLATSGFMGLPFVEDATDFTEGVLKVAGYKNANATKLYYDIMGDIMHPKMAEAIFRGGFRFAGVDIGRRVGLGTHPISGGLIDFLFSDKGFSKASIPLFSVLSKPSIAYDYLKVDDVGLAVAELMPKPFANVMKGIHLKRDGYQTRLGDQVVIPENVSSFDSIMQVLGFTPADIAREREAMYLTKTERNASAHISRRFYRKIQKYGGQIHRAEQSGNKKALKNANDNLREVYEDIYEHNQKMIKDGKLNMIVDINKRTVRRNLLNEINGFASTLSDLPSDAFYVGEKRLKNYPRGID